MEGVSQRSDMLASWPELPLRPEQAPDVLARLKAIPDPARLKQTHTFVAEGRASCIELLLHPNWRCEVIAGSPASLRALKEQAPAPKYAQVMELSGPELRRWAGLRPHQDCVALGRLPEPMSWADFMAKQPRPRLLVAWEVTNPDNVGSLFRNARAFGVSGLVIGPGCPHPLYRKVIRTSIGGVFHLPFYHASELAALLAQLRSAQLPPLALEHSPEARSIGDVSQTDYAPGWALFVGNEGAGLPQPVLDAAAQVLAIPMEAGVPSINVAAASAIALHRLLGPLGQPICALLV